MAEKNKALAQAAHVPKAGRASWRIRGFLRDELGATTVEFVLLTAMVVSLTMAVMLSITNGAEATASRLSQCMEIQGRLMAKDLTQEQRLKRLQRRCGRL